MTPFASPSTSLRIYSPLVGAFGALALGPQLGDILVIFARVIDRCAATALALVDFLSVNVTCQTLDTCLISPRESGECLAVFESTSSD